MKLKQYKTYRFKEQDPLIGQVLMEIRTTFAEVGRKSGVSPSTLSNWKHKRSRRTFASTLNAVARSSGKKLALVDIKKRTSPG